MPSPTAMRQHMILGQLFTNDINDKRILTAMAEMPREPFLPDALRGAAYVDDNLTVSPGRYLLAPLTFARLLDIAEIAPASRALVIGCLSGYTAAIVAKLAATVVAIDSDPSAISEASAHMKRLGIANVNVQAVSAMNQGYNAGAPYDLIVICGAIQAIPETIGAQLAEGGSLVTVQNKASRPGMKDSLGKGLLVKRIDGKLQHREHFDLSASLLPGFETPAGFRF